jgi:hypothetical protein
MPRSSTPERAAELGRHGGRASAARRTPEQHAANGRRMRLALAVRELVDQAPELTDEQRRRLASILRPPEAPIGVTRPEPCHDLTRSQPRGGQGRTARRRR